MSLIKCPECGKEISDSIEKCIHCGFPLKKMSKNNKPNKAMLPGGISLVVIASILLSVFSITIILIGSIFFGIYIKNKPSRERVKTCFNLIEEKTDGNGVISKIYYSEELDYCYIIMEDGDEATIDLESNKCGLKSDYDNLFELNKLAKDYGNDKLAKEYALEIISHDYNVFIPYDFVSKPSQFVLIYEK